MLKADTLINLSKFYLLVVVPFSEMGSSSLFQSLHQAAFKMNGRKTHSSLSNKKINLS